ncbi:MAG TPA: phosphotransferase, partial [Thermomicrobiales bacterium]|nr:phosphotransferase [Thermomicrobiales bacterium]
GSGSFILKWYRNEGVEDRLRFEHALLGALADAQLPFDVPAPVPARSGETMVDVEIDRRPCCMALFRLIAGRAAEDGNLDEARRCGEALAILDRAMASVALAPDVPIPDTFGDLATVHPRVPCPTEALGRLFDSHGDATVASDVVTRVEELWQHHTAAWEYQIIHGDFYPSNTLVHAGRVTAILDFEYSGMGHRAMDFAIGLASFSVKDGDADRAWPLIDSFATGYLREARLDERELSAIPALLLMREVTSLIHWLGRMEQGLTAREEIHSRVDRLLALDRWLAAQGAALVERLLTIDAG